MGYVKDFLFKIVGEDTHETKANLWRVDPELAHAFGRLVTHGKKLNEIRHAIHNTIERDAQGAERPHDAPALESSVGFAARRYEIVNTRFDEAEVFFRSLWLNSAIPTGLVEDAIRQARIGKGVNRTDKQTLDAIADALSIEEWTPTTLEEIALLVSQTGRTFNSSTNKEGETK